MRVGDVVPQKLTGRSIVTPEKVVNFHQVMLLKWSRSHLVRPFRSSTTCKHYTKPVVICYFLLFV